MSNPYEKSRVILPNDLIIEVLSFSDVKSLMQMKCICKSWNSIISDPKFAKLHLKRSARNPHLILVSDTAVPLPVCRLTKSSKITLTSDPYYRLWNKDCSYLIGSCNGLLCLLGSSSYHITYTNTWLRFWNPATHKMSSKLGLFWDNFRLYTHFKFGFGYDKLLETFKVVRLFFDEDEERIDVQVLSLGDNVWRPIQSFPMVLVPFQTNPGVNGGVYLNGCLNWLALRSKLCYVDVSGLEKMDIREFVIVSLDLGTETYTQLMPPGG